MTKTFLVETENGLALMSYRDSEEPNKHIGTIPEFENISELDIIPKGEPITIKGERPSGDIVFLHQEAKEMLEKFSKMKEDGCSLYDLLAEASRSLQYDDFKVDIPALKKRIRRCKNPLERKELEKQLNEAYKEKKFNEKNKVNRANVNI